MEKLGYAASFRDLLAYQKARELSQEIFSLSKSLPREETYSLTDQIRRSSRSIGAQIAEAWAKRRYEKHFLSKLTDADGEQQETQHWIGVCLDCGYISIQEAEDLQAKCERIGRLIGGMISKAELFCNPTSEIREVQADYFVQTPPSQA
jgi:four helix bundle protein